MVVISVSLSGTELKDFDQLVDHFKYDNRSSAVRDALYHFIASHRLEFSKEPMSLVFTLIYDPKKHMDEVHQLIHEHGDLVKTSLHNHMGKQCVDVLVVHGKGDQVHELLDALTRVKDVRVNVTPL